MMSTHFSEAQLKLFEAIAIALGHSFPQLSELVAIDPDCNLPMEFSITSGKPSYFVLDITFEDDGSIRLIEANGSNANLTSVSLGHDDFRAEHMRYCFREHTAKVEDGIILLPYSDHFIHVAEFFSRTLSFVKRLSPQYPIHLRSVNDTLVPDAMNLVWGNLSAISRDLAYEEQSLKYRGRSVIFATNPGLIGEVLRTNSSLQTINLEEIGDKFHEGSGLRVILNKVEQQAICTYTGIKPLLFQSANDWRRCIEVIEQFQQLGLVAVGKISCGSGAVGVRFFTPECSQTDVITKLEEMKIEAKARYGGAFENTIFPIMFFEFARSTLVQLHDGGHLWDLRMECLVYPDKVLVLPGLVRICPASFDGINYDRNSVVSNLTGRKPSLEFTRSIMSATTRAELGLSVGDISNAARICAEWCTRATGAIDAGASVKVVEGNG